MKWTARPYRPHEPSASGTRHLRSLALLALPALLGALLALFLATFLPGQFEARTELLVNARALPGSGIPAVGMESQMRLAVSGRVIDRLIRELDLVSDPEFNGEAGPLAWMDIPRNWLSERGTEKQDETRRHAITARNLLNRLEASQPGQSWVILLAVRSATAMKAALIANRWAAILQEESATLLGPVTLISDAKTPLAPVGVPPTLLVICGTILGLFAGIAALALRLRQGAASAAAKPAPISPRRRHWRYADTLEDLCGHEMRRPAAGPGRHAAHVPDTDSTSPMSGKLAAIRNDLREIRGTLHDLAEIRGRTA